MKKIFNSNVLKIIAILAMLLDHIALAFLSFDSFLYIVFRFIGRISAPIMFYCLSKGYFYTKNKFRYGTRLFLFALISQVPYSLFFYNKIFYYENYNIIFTLFLGFLCLLSIDKVDDFLVKYSTVALCFMFSYFCDGGSFWLFLSLIFYFSKGNYKWILYSVMCVLYIGINYGLYHSLNSFLISIGLFLVVPFIYLDNNQKGKYNLKYLFYVFYPLHMLFLFILK